MAPALAGTVGLFLDHPRVPRRPVASREATRRSAAATARRRRSRPRHDGSGGGQDSSDDDDPTTTTTTTAATAPSPTASSARQPDPRRRPSQAPADRPDHPPVMTRVDLAFPSMGGEARVRLESVLYDEAELAALADGIHSQHRGGRGRPLALRPRQRAEPAQRRPAPGGARLPAAAARGRGRRCGRPTAATGSSTRRCSASSSGPATPGTGRRPTAPTSTSRSPPLPRAARPRRPSGASATACASTARGGSCGRPGVRLDPGGIAKGMAADLAAASLPAGVRYAISCGGDLAVGGERPWDVAVRSARNEAEVHRLRVRSGGVATSGIGARIWQTEDGRYAHHVIDPATGRPAWTGLVAVDRGGRQRARGRGAREGRAALRPARRAAAAAAPRRRAPARRRPRRDRAGARRRAAAAPRRGMSTDPLDYPFWLASRSAGVVAYLLLSGSVDPRPRDVDAARDAGATSASCTSGSRCWRSARWPPTGCCCSRTAGCSRSSPRS